MRHDPASRPHDHETRVKTAQRYARWHLGDANWAGNILFAYFNPDDANAVLDDQGAPR
jgi:hypothetical protein